MGLIKTVLAVDVANNILNEYPDLLQGIGVFPGEHSFTLDPTVKPVVHPQRRIPIALSDKVNRKLDEMEAQEVIQKETGPTEWVNSMVVVEKPGGQDIRICLDPKNLNQAIQREHYPMKTLEDVKHKLAGARLFSKLDAKGTLRGKFSCHMFQHAVWQVQIPTLTGRSEDISRHVCPTNGWILWGCARGLCIVDDILVYGRNQEEHDRYLRSTLDRARQRGVKLNPKKCEIGVKEVKYYGSIITSEGEKPDPNKVHTITNMPYPESKEKVRTFLGMVNYLAKFSEKLASVSSPLRALLKEDVMFTWTEHEQQAYDKIKQIIVQSPTLAYFSDKPETLQCDASQHGVRACIMQEGRPVAYGSRSLTETEQNWAQIEKELFPIVYGCDKFKHYVYGQEITVETDHKPLKAIFKKPIGQTPARLQRMLMSLQPYNINLKFKPGKQIPVAATLSRRITPDLSHQDRELSKRMEAQVHTILHQLPVSESRIEEIGKETDKDLELLALKKSHRWLVRDPVSGEPTVH